MVMEVSIQRHKRIALKKKIPSKSLRLDKKCLILSNLEKNPLTNTNISCLSLSSLLEFGGSLTNPKDDHKWSLSCFICFAFPFIFKFNQICILLTFTLQNSKFVLEKTMLSYSFK